MTVAKKIAHNTLIHLSGKIISLILGLVSVAIMTRYLGQTGFGYYITVTAFLGFFGILVDFGLSMTTVQMISDNEEKMSKIVNSIMSLRVISSFLFLGLAPIIVWFFPYNIFIKLGVLLAVGSYFCLSLVQTLTGVFQKKLKMMEITLAEVAGRVLLVGLVALTAFLGKNIYWIFGSITLGSVLNLLIVFLFSKKYIQWHWQVDTKIWKEVLSRAWPIALSIGFNLVYLRMDTIILSLTGSQAEVGLYGATYRVVDILTMMPAVFMGLVLPVAAKYFLQDKKQQLKDLLQKAFNALMIFAVPIVAGTILVANKLMVFIAGKDFYLSGDILKVLIFASGAIFATTLFSYAVVAVKKQKAMMWGYLAVAVLTMIGYLIFIPKYGYWGAAWMTLFSEVLILIWTAVLIYKTIGFFPNLKIFSQTVPASLIMMAVLYYWQNNHVLVLLLVATMVYFSFLYILGGVKKQTIRELLRLKD
ncbi:MAG TPA: flippase [Patescibacteria group bacterium]|nr:flippase [Patescibacteria group bacterium]